MSIFDGSGSAPYAGSVLVEGERIARVAAGADALDGEACDTRIDGAGRT
jgi:N-acyl-D-aspartate/D-glutamate deacylase